MCCRCIFFVLSFFSPLQFYDRQIGNTIWGGLAKMLKEAIYSSFAQVEYCMSVLCSMRFSFFIYYLVCPNELHLIIPTVVSLCSVTCKINVSSFHLLYLQRSSVYEVKYLSGGARHAPLFSGEHFLSHLFHSFHLPRLSLSFSICHSFSCLIGRSILCFTW